MLALESADGTYFKRVIALGPDLFDGNGMPTYEPDTYCYRMSVKSSQTTQRRFENRPGKLFTLYNSHTYRL